MKEKAPKLEEWRQLYQAAIEFKNMKPWEWMYDDDIFAIKDPETGEISYCCIMGNLGEHFGIAGYLGPEGLDGILSMLSGELDPEDLDAMYMQKCLMASFENRDMLSEEDRKIIKELGFKFRGKNEWPLFRNYTPGLFPWFINDKECRFLTHILLQAMHVALMCRDEGKEILYHEDSLTFLTRIPEERDGRLEWHDEYIPATPYTPQYASFYLEDEIRLRRLQLLGRRRGSAWEIDTFYSPGPVRDNDRPYYPKICLIIEQSRGLVLSFNMVKDIKKEGFKFINMFIELIERLGQFPSRVFVQREETYYLLKDICSQLGINIEIVDKLHILQNARYEMYNYFNGLF
ncbi:MAG: hypothetical protein HPY74_13305 [Firmicutes bacterium]|nr:hypothetical protein [Bacillota bacterium]